MSQENAPIPSSLSPEHLSVALRAEMLLKNFRHTLEKERETQVPVNSANTSKERRISTTPRPREGSLLAGRKVK